MSVPGIAAVETAHFLVVAGTEHHAYLVAVVALVVETVDSTVVGIAVAASRQQGL